MATSATGSRSAEAGISLIELLVGMVIAATVLGAAMMALPRTGERKVEQAALQARALVAHACERAELLGEDIDISVDERGLVFAVLRGDQWQVFPESPDEPLRPRRPDPAITLAMGAAQPLPPGVGRDGAHALCMASGEPTPFVLEVRGPNGLRHPIRIDVATLADGMPDAH